MYLLFIMQGRWHWKFREYGAVPAHSLFWAPENTNQGGTIDYKLLHDIRFDCISLSKHGYFLVPARVRKTWEWRNVQLDGRVTRTLNLKGKSQSDYTSLWLSFICVIKWAMSVMHSPSPGIHTSQKFCAISCSGKVLHTALGADFYHSGRTFESVPPSVEHGRLCNEQHFSIYLHSLVIDEAD